MSPKTLWVGDDVLGAELVFLSVGARALVPDLPGVHDVPYLTNSSLLKLDVVPRHLVIVGGSYIGGATRQGQLCPNCSYHLKPSDPHSIHVHYISGHVYYYW
jgi:hypothetical protein